MRIPFSEWKPDSPDLGSDDVTANNVIPDQEGYRPLPSPVPFSNALTARCQGAAVARDSTGYAYNLAGDVSDLYVMGSGGQFNKASKAGGYSTPSDGRWEFVQWGNAVLATNFGDNPQIATLTPSGNISFANLGGSPPKARHIGIVRDFVVLANINDPTAGLVPQRVQWSGVNSETTWGFNAAAQSDSQDLVGDGGWNQAVVGGEYGLIFQERAIWRMTYVGSPVIFQFDVMEKDRGALAPGSVINIGRMTFYLSYDGFYAFNGLMSVPIGLGKINRWFFQDLDQSYVNRISSAIDPINGIVFWTYPGQGNVGGLCNRLLAYHIGFNKWSTGDAAFETLARSLSVPYTLDQLDAFGTLEQLKVSLDSRVWMGGAINMSAFDGSHVLNNFTGAPLPATLDTAEVELTSGSMAMISSVLPLVADGDAQVSVGTRFRQADSVTWTTPIDENEIGECPVRATGRYGRFRVQTTGNFTHALGVDVTAIPRGGR